MTTAVSAVSAVSTDDSDHYCPSSSLLSFQLKKLRSVQMTLLFELQEQQKKTRLETVSKLTAI
jgi:hypothetical protein